MGHWNGGPGNCWFGYLLPSNKFAISRTFSFKYISCFGCFLL
jgi:hypothetical protein